LNLENIKKPELVKDLNFLRVTNLSVFYKRKKILNDINLLLKEGEVVGLLGPNGAGKTTFFSKHSRFA
jgi:ABC-type multidrug transport system ATPase subunit